MIDTFLKICNNWNSFHNDTVNIKSNLIKNAYPLFLFNKAKKKYLDYKFSSNQNQLKDTSEVYCFKLPYIDNLSHHIKNILSKIEEFCKENCNIKLVLNSFKIKNYFSYKGPIPDDLKSFLAYKFTCARCGSSYMGKFVVILKLGLWKISIKIISIICLSIDTPPQHALNRIILFLLR